MLTPTPWDVRIVDASDLSVVAYVPQWEAVEFADSILEQGHGSLTFDYDSDWVTSFHTANSKYPWEGNYGIQVLRAGTVAYTFLIEEAEVEYAGDRRRVAIGGRGLAACLEWAIVLPEGFDESAANPDDDTNYQLRMARGFGKVFDTEEELDAGTYTIDNPKWPAQPGGAFVFLFNEADTGNAQTWANYTQNSASRNGAGVTWPLSLDSNMSHTNDANNNSWSDNTKYAQVDVTHLITSITSGMTMFEALSECCTLQANAQWVVSPTGVISIANSLGTDRSSSVLLSVPQATRTANQLNSRDVRSRLYGSNGYLFEAATDSSANTLVGRREGFINADQAKGEYVVDEAKYALEKIKDALDEFTFDYVETDATRAFVDFQVGDSVNIEYKPGLVQNRQISGLGASINADGVQIQVVVGDIVKNAIVKLQRKIENDSFTAEVTSRAAKYSKLDKNKSTPMPPRNFTATPFREGEVRGCKFNWDRPLGEEDTIAGFKVEVHLASNTSKKFDAYVEIDRTTVGHEVDITGLGTKGGTYKARIKSVGKNGNDSDWIPAAYLTFTMTESGEGGATDPHKPPQITGLSLFPMLNAVIVKFTDFAGNTGDNSVTYSANRGKYEVQISNATGGFNETTGNTWTTTVGTDTSGETGAACKQFFVTGGGGYVCGGLTSGDDPGTTHYVRVRCINWDGTEGDWSSVGNVVLNKDDESQVGVLIGKDTIAASHIASHTITANEIAAGAITANEIDVDQVLTSAVRMPQPASASNADGSSYPGGSAMTFNIDKDGNMWWGDFDTYAKALTGELRSGGAASTNNWQTRIKDDGTEVFFGDKANGNYFHYDTNTFQFALGSGNNNGYFSAGNIAASHNLFAFGASAPYMYMSGVSDSGFGLNGQSLSWGSSSSNLDYYGSIKGGLYSSLGSNWRGVWMGSGDNFYRACVSADDNIPILVNAGGSGQSIMLNANDNIYLWPGASGVVSLSRPIYLTSSTPSNPANHLYNDGGTLKWDGAAIGGSGGNSWYFKVQGDTGEEIAEASSDFIDLQYPTASAQKGIEISRSGNVATISHHVKNYTGSNLNGASGAPYMIWGIESGYSYKTTVSAMITYMTGLGGSGLMTQTGVLNTASLVNYTTTANIPTAAHQGSYGSSSNNSGQDFIQDIFVDSQGHITGVGVATASGSSGLTSITADTNWGLSFTGSPAVNAGVTFWNMQGGTPTASSQIAYSGSYGRPMIASAYVYVNACMGSNLSLGSTTGGSYWVRFTWGKLEYLTSTQAVKQHITTVPGAEALARVKALRPVNFYYNDKVEPDNPMSQLEKKRGFIAEEVAAVDHSLGAYGWLDDDGKPINPEEHGKTLDDAVPTIYEVEAILADVVAALQQMESRIAALEG